MSFPKQIALATVVVAGAVGGLFLLGQQEAEQSSYAGSVAEPAVAPAAREKEKEIPVKGFEHGTRSLVPASAWLVADFRGDLTGNAPFSDADGLCGKVPAPKRVALAVLPPVGASGPVLLLAAPEVEEIFWGCARDRIVRAGGVPLAQNDQFDVLKSPSGVVARGPGGGLIFISDEAQLELALSVLTGMGESASSAGTHARLFRRMHPEPSSDEPKSALDLTLALPANWLASVGEDANKSPLRHVSAAFLSLEESGGAQGGIDCQEAGCQEVLVFLKRAQTDLTRQLPPGLAQSIGKSLHAEHVNGTGRIALRWSPTDIRLQQLLGQFLGGGPIIP